MYFAQHTQNGNYTSSRSTAVDALQEAENWGWEDCEVELMEMHPFGDTFIHFPAEFPCTYSFHYGEESYTCELTANRPDSLCPFHAGEED